MGLPGEEEPAVAGEGGRMGSPALGIEACKFVGRTDRRRYHCPDWRLRGGWAKERRG